MPYISSISQVNNPITGAFGTGQVQVFSSSGVWTVPAGISRVRVRMWGGGGGSFTGAQQTSGSGGGFALKAIYDLSGVTSIPVTVGAAGTTGNPGLVGGTSSFGSYVSATGGQSGAASNVTTAGTGVGGDINTSGGASNNTTTSGGGGAGSLFGTGGAGTNNGVGNSGGSGGGSYSASTTQISTGGNGILGRGSSPATYTTNGGLSIQMPTTGQEGGFSIDFIGTGGGGGSTSSSNLTVGGINGGGGGWSAPGGFPGGGGGYNSTSAAGLVIVEW